MEAPSWAIPRTRSPRRSAPTVDTPPPQECDDIRAKALADSAISEARKRTQMAETLEGAIAFLQANKDHIAALVLVVQAFHNDKVIEADRDATDGRAQVTMVDESYRTTLVEQTKRALESSARGHRDPLAALLAGL